ncbi:MAG: hypothetical protein JST01_08750 [Cyanobacteria bacterium SZAS TMP-1]|nr:hypothetical protein [Cyanobacteria bacterium SZAS TMP-1]
MYNISTPRVAAIAAVAITLMSSLPSFAWSNHPRKQEVLRRDNQIKKEINCNKGNLNGHFGQLKAEDKAIKRQEQRDFRKNGGFLARGQQIKLNREENKVQRQINRDERK